MAYDPALYMHDLDKKAFDALNLFPQFVKLQKAYIANVDEKAAKIELLSTAIRLSDKQMPEVHALLPPICEKLGVDVPALYMVQSQNKRDLNAFTGGIAAPFVCVTSELVKQMPPQMTASILAHECGHIACKHYLYHSLARNFANGIEASPLYKIPAIRRCLTKTLIRALLFWDRCSELSADRAAVLCDGDAGKTIDALLRAHGFEDNIDRDEFIKQSLDLKEFINSSDANKMIEQMIVEWNSHPLLATRAYECYDWSHTDLYQRIINGTYTKTAADRSAAADKEESPVLTAEVSATVKGPRGPARADPAAADALEERLRQLNAEIQRYTLHDERALYAYGISCGIISGWLDSLFFSDTAIFGNNLVFSHRQVNNFIQEYASARGSGNDGLKNAISELEKAFPVAQDNIWKGKGISVTPKTHHLADLAHHPTPVGLVSALMVQFLRIGTFVNKKGEWHFIFVDTSLKDAAAIAVPAIITGVLNWLVAISSNRYEAETGKEMPKAIRRLAHVAASAPAIIEIAKCADNWFGHLVSDMGGSKNTPGGGMGIPGVFLSLLYEISAIPIFKDTGLIEVLNDFYENKKIDLRHELAFGQQVKTQAIPVIFNEIAVRLGCMLLHFETEALAHNGLKGIDWRYVIPFGNRTVDRMIAVAAMTFNVVDTGDAAIRAAIESGGNWAVFSGRFVARYNFVGAGRAAVAIVKEFSNEKKEAQLIHERMLLMDAKAHMLYDQLQEFKARLNEKLTEYLVEDIKSFMEGFDDIDEGLRSNNSDLVIQGNVTIQKVLGREPQFTSQKEFDGLMDSDIPLQL